MLRSAAKTLDSVLFPDLKVVDSLWLNRLFKLAWTIAVALCFNGLAVYSKQAYRKWHIAPEISIASKTVPSVSVPFPAVTICQPTIPSEAILNMSPDRLFTLTDLGEHTLSLTEMQQSYLSLVVHTCHPEHARVANEKVCTNRTKTSIVELLSKTTYKFNIEDCYFRDDVFDCAQMMNKSLTDYGFCDTYNMQDFSAIFRESALSRDFGVYTDFFFNRNHSLRDLRGNATMWTLDEGYSTDAEHTWPVRALKNKPVSIYYNISGLVLYCTDMNRSVKIIFHMPNEIPTLFHASHFVESGYAKELAISAKIHKASENMRGHTPETRGCYFKGEKRLKFFKTYTKALCDFECMTNFTLKQCGCVKFNMPRSADTNVCDLDKVECYNDIKESWPNVNHDDRDQSCACYPPCTNIEYSVHVIRNSKRYDQAMLQYLGRGYIEEAYKTHVTVTCSEHVAEELTSYVTYTIQNLIADCGGLIGLFLGFSLLSIYELASNSIVFCVKFSYRKLCKGVSENLCRILAEKIIKLAWATAWLLSFSGFVFYSTGSFQKWYIKPDISTTIRQISSREIPMVAVTVCNPHFPTVLLKTQMNPFDHVRYENSRENFSTQEQNYMGVYFQTCKDGDFGDVYKTICPNRSNTNVIELLLDAQYKDGISDWEHQSFFGTNKDGVLGKTISDFGLCDSFNLLNYKTLFNEGVLSKNFDFYKHRKTPSNYIDFFAPLHQTNDDANWTLADGFKTEDSKVIPLRALRTYITLTITHSLGLMFCYVFGRGYKVFFHLPNEMLTPFHEYKFVNFQREMNFAVGATVYRTSESMRGYSPEIRQCYFEGEKRLRFFRSYTKALCEFECLTNFTLQHCGCVKFTMPRAHDTRVCDLDKVECCDRVKDAWPLIVDNKSSTDVSETCKCLKPCVNIEYSIEDEKDGLLQRENAKTVIMTAFTSDQIEEHVNFVAYGLQNFVADCGGLIGLFLGFSLLSIFDLINLLISFYVKFKRNRIHIVAKENTSNESEIHQNRCFGISLKLFWMISVFFSICGLIFYSQQAFIKWHIAPDITTMVREIPSHDIPMPAVTICPTVFPREFQMRDNPIHIMIHVLKSIPIEPISPREQNYINVVLQTCCPRYYAAAAQKICTNRTETDIVKLLFNSNPTNRFRVCEFRGVDTHCTQLLRLALTEYGICHTANMQSRSIIFREEALNEHFKRIFTERNFHPLHNISAMLRTGDRGSEWTLERGFTNNRSKVYPIRGMKMNSIGAIAEIRPGPRIAYCKFHSPGLILFLHLPNEVPSPLHKTFFVNFQRKKIFKIHARLYNISSALRRYSPEIRRCYYEGEKRLRFFKSYTKTLCEYECLTNYTLQHCGCVKFNMPRREDTKVCDIDKFECYMDAQTNLENDVEAKKKCDCMQSCVNIEYDVQVDYDVDYDERSLFKTQFRLALASHLVEEHTSYVAYTVQNFIADCGGLIGLFLGFSLLSIFELACNLLTACIRKRNEKHTFVAWSEN